MNKDKYDKFVDAMRIAYEYVAQDMDEEGFNDDEIMFEVTTDADRMHMFGGLTYEEQQEFYALPHDVKFKMFLKIR